jgi:hypothetical protein
MRRSRSVVLALAAAIWFGDLSCYAHSGRTDSSGGHYNRKTGRYHYHGLSSASSSISTTWLGRESSRSNAPSRARTHAPERSTTRARSYDPAPLISRITDESIPYRDEEPPPKVSEPPRDLAKEERAKKLLAYAKKQIDEGKREIGIKYLRRIVTVYEDTLAAPEARETLRWLRENEPVREWVDKGGKHSVRAVFVRLENDLVYLRREDQRLIAVAVSDFSHTDRLYVIHREGLTSLKNAESEELQ